MGKTFFSIEFIANNIHFISINHTFFKANNIQHSPLRFKQILILIDTTIKIKRKLVNTNMFDNKIENIYQEL